MEKVKILFWGDAVVSTGFSRVLHSIAENLPPYYDISWLGVNYFGDPHKYPYKIYPAGLRGQIYGGNRFVEVATTEKPDVIFLLNDAWIQGPMLEEIKKFYGGNKYPKIVTYTPVDAKNHDADWYRHFDIVNHAVAYTEFGKDEILQVAPFLESKMSIIPHGVDTSTFFKIQLPREEIKKLVFPAKADFLDSFVVLNANRNQPRKRIDITMKAFKLFSDGKPENVKLYLHMGIVDAHINIQKMARRLGIEERLIVTSARGGIPSTSIDKLNFIYNACDIGVNTAVGEGWSLTNMEHAVTGAPQIVADNSALRELYYDCGALVKPTMEYTLDNVMTTGYLVSPEDVAEKLELLYNNKNLYDLLSNKVYTKFTSPEYSWKNISRQWVELFEN